MIIRLIVIVISTIMKVKREDSNTKGNKRVVFRNFKVKGYIIK